MKASKMLVLKIVVGLAIALIIVIISGYLNVLQRGKAEKKISAEARPEKALISSVFIDNDLVLEVLPAIAKQAGVSIIPENSVSGLVTCDLKDVPLDKALEIVLTDTPYIVKKMPNHYLICPGDIKTTQLPLAGIRVIPLSNRSVLALSPDDVAEIMRRAGFSNDQILEYGTELRNGLAESGAVQIKNGEKVEAVFAINLEEGNRVYISTRLRGNFIYDVDAGWVGKQ